MRTLIVHAGGIGDFLLTCPALACLSHDGPVDVIGHPARASLAVPGGVVSRVFSLEDPRLASLWTGIPDSLCQAFLADYDRVICWMRDPEGCLKNAFVKAGISQVHVFPGIPPDTWTRHASEYYLACLGLENPVPFRLQLTPVAGAPDVVIHAGSGGRSKNWPLEHFAAVADVLTRQGRHVFWTRGPAEELLALPANAQTLPAQSLEALARVLAGTALYIGNDSGITHLAAAAGCRSVIAIFGPTDPRVWAPRGAAVRVLGGRGVWPAAAPVLALAS